MQSVFGSNIEFSMRTFLFKTNGSSAEEQQQTISCNLHLDPAAEVSSTEPDDCSCYSEEECSGKLFFKFRFVTNESYRMSHIVLVISYESTETLLDSKVMFLKDDIVFWKIELFSFIFFFIFQLRIS